MKDNKNLKAIKQFILKKLKEFSIVLLRTLIAKIIVELLFKFI
ncbi:hypothetical protein [Clostridium sp.]